MKSIPVIQSVQGGRTLYSGKASFIELCRMFKQFDRTLPLVDRAQRVLDQHRAKAIAKYILENPKSYILPAITASCDSEMLFKPIGEGQNMGALVFPFTARVLVNDGQHRTEGIRLALEENPDLADEGITVSIYHDQGLDRRKQDFTDLNFKQVKPSSSICLAFDTRSSYSQWIFALLEELPAIMARIEMEQAAPGKKSDKLWSLVAFSQFVTLLTGISAKNISKSNVDLGSKTSFVLEFVNALGTIPMWNEMLVGMVSAEEMRNDYILSHAVFLNALGTFGAKLDDITKMEGLSIVSPSKTSPMWENRCINRGKMQKNGDGIKSTAAVLMKCCGVEMPPEIARLDALCVGGTYAE